MNDKKYDVIVYGATSFVGQIITHYMHETFPGGAGGNALTWAVAGRSKSKLEQVAGDVGLEGIDMIVADASDEAALQSMCDDAKVIMSTVGPYALYGDLLVKLCAESGTRYCDLTGEPQWIRRMQDRHEAKAKETGALIVHCCGFDSIPSDLGVHFLQTQAKERFGSTCEKVDMRVAKMKGGASGGTIASMINLVKEASSNPKLRKELKDPYSICPPNHGFTTRQRDVKMEFDEAYGSWIAPFVMAAINTRVVHRSNALAGNAYGENFLYEEAMATGTAARGKRAARMTDWGMGAMMVAMALSPVRWLLEKTVLPAPGEGPSPKEQLEGSFILDFIGKADDGETIRARVTGDRDPGYGSTAKMLAQAAVCLAKDVPDDAAGGFWTPATILGDPLIERLRAHSGLTFELTD
ncbi:MAG: saccharopine dehydrogenase NADP-binding domain-containing protein [Pseudomonadota bacterium]